MNLQEYKNQKIEYRMLKNTTNPDSDTRNKMVGKIFEQCAGVDIEGDIGLWLDEYKTDSLFFHQNDLQKVTPLTHNGYRIGIGDVVEWNEYKHEVYDCIWYSGEWLLCVARINDGVPDYGCGWTFLLQTLEIKSVTPLYQSDINKDTWLKQGQEKGWIKEGKIIT